MKIKYVFFGWLITTTMLTAGILIGHFKPSNPLIGFFVGLASGELGAWLGSWRNLDDAE